VPGRRAQIDGLTTAAIDRRLSDPQPAFQSRSPARLIHRCAVLFAPQLTIRVQRHDPAAFVRPINARQQCLVRNAFHPELCGLVVRTASQPPVRALGRGTFTSNGSVDTGGEVQRGLIGDDPGSLTQPFAALPAHLIIMEVGGSAARTKGHRDPSSATNLVFDSAPVAADGADSQRRSGPVPGRHSIKANQTRADVLVDRNHR
jgi:hypothetical protein